MGTSALIPKRPRGREWERLPDAKRAESDASAIEVWVSGPIRVTSSAQIAELPSGGGSGPQWLVGISNNGKRPKPHHVRRALRAFGMIGGDNDAHHPGVAVHYWLPFDEAHRVACQCKEDEDVIVEPDGYRWTNPKPESGEPCRGCEFEVSFGKRCPIHSNTEERDTR